MKKNEKDLNEEFKEAQQEYIENILSEKGQTEIKENEELEEEFKEAQKDYIENVLSEKGQTEVEELFDEPNQNKLKKNNTKRNKRNVIAIVAISFGCFILLALIIIKAIVDNSKELVLAETKISDIDKMTKQEKKINNMTDNQKQISGISANKEDEKINNIIEKQSEQNKTEEYKKYEQLTDSQKEKQEIIPREETVDFEEIEKIDKELKEETSDTTIPKKYNLKDLIKVKVENQESFGLCWDFASTQSVQTNLALTQKKDVDIAEIHPDYIMSSLMYGTRKIHDGGNFDIYEDYTLVSQPVNDSILEYKDQGEIDIDQFLNTPKEDMYITETVNYPNLYKDDNETEEEFVNRRQELLNVIKMHIKTKGSLYASIVTPDDDRKYYNPTTYAQYFNGDYDLTNPDRLFHAISIVGWDDDYKKENFNQELQPKHDGAFIALNSWSEYWGDGGYFYISYEDESIYQDINGIMSTSIDDAYDLSAIKNAKIRKILDEKLSYSYIEKDNKKYVTKLALSKITNLDLSDSNLTNEDLQYLNIFPNLYTLNISNNNISDLSYIGMLNKLTWLDISNNNITDVTPLSLLKELIVLDAKNNNISDVSILGNSNIYRIDLSGNKNVSGFEQIQSLSELLLNNTDANLSNIALLNNLYLLELSNNNLINLNSFPTNFSGILDLSNCHIESIYEIPPINNNIEINLSGNNLKSIDGIEHILKARSIDLSNNKDLKDYTPLNLISLKEESNNEYNTGDYELNYPIIDSLAIKNNNIEDISIINDLNVYNLDISNNKIKDLSNYNNKSIRSIDISNNKGIENIDKLKGITSITAKSCNISSIDEFTNLDQLLQLDLSNNDIKDISNLSKTNIEYLSLENNKNISGIIKSEKLVSLNVKNCNLESFDLSDIPNLFFINISDNNYKNISEITSVVSQPLSITGENITINKNDFIDIMKSDNYIYLSDFKYETDITYTNNLYDIKNSNIRQIFMQALTKDDSILKNATIDNKVTKIEKKDASKKVSYTVSGLFGKVCLYNTEYVFN